MIPHLDWPRLIADYRAHVMSQPVPQLTGMIGIIVRKPYQARDIDRLNDLLDERDRRELTLDVYETESRVSILAYTPVRRLGRQVS